MRWAHNYGVQEKKLHEKNAISDLHEIYSTLKNNINEYSFYSTGHPYVWVDSNKIKMEKQIISTCTRSFPGSDIYYDKAIYSLKIDQNNKSIYYVTDIENFDFNSLMHYQEWLDSQQQVAQNIAKHKNS
jgi:hypothetical protein